MSPKLTTNDLRQRACDLRFPATLTSPKKPKQSRQSPKLIKVINKCYSEPIIFEAIGDGDSGVGGCRSFDSSEGGRLSRFSTLDDVLSCTSELFDSPTSRINAGYEKDAKVLITVTVEGSPGPLRTLVKLGTSVEDTIKLVLQKYREEGRAPQLGKDSSTFDLHVSYFSLQSLERSDLIGEAGSRSFYLRKNDKKCHEVASTSTFVESEIQCDNVNDSMLSPPKQLRPPMAVFPPFLAQKMNKIERRLFRLLKVMGCLDSR